MSSKQPGLSIRFHLREIEYKAPPVTETTQGSATSVYRVQTLEHQFDGNRVTIDVEDRLEYEADDGAVHILCRVRGRGTGDTDEPLSDDDAISVAEPSWDKSSLVIAFLTQIVFRNPVVLAPFYKRERHKVLSFHLRGQED